MEPHMHDSLIDHYKNKGRAKGSKHVQIESIIKQNLQKKQN